MRYWISPSEGNVEGPFDESELRNMLSEGSITHETQACAENTENWLALGTIPGFVAPGGSVTSGTPALQSSSYTFRDAFGKGWELFTTRYPIVLGVTLFMMLASIIPAFCTTPLNILTSSSQQGGSGGGEMVILQMFGSCFQSAWSFLVATPISIGAIWVLIRIGRGHADASFSDIWAPFKRYGWVLVTQLLLMACSLVIFLLAVIAGGIPGTLVGLLVGALSESVAAGVISGSGIGLIIFIPMMYYLIVRIMLSYVLIIDPEAGLPNSIDALAMSWNVTKGHGWSLFGLMFVMGLIVMASFFFCVLPVFFFGYPLFMAVLAAAYCLLLPGVLVLTRCSTCGYSRAPGSSGNCPECGAEWEEPATT